MSDSCDWLRAAVSRTLEKYEDLAFRAGQGAAGMTRAEAEKVHAEDEEELHAAFMTIAKNVDQLVACEIRASGGNLSPESAPEAVEASEETTTTTTTARKTIVVTSPDCEGCRALLAKIEGKPIEIKDLSTDEGIVFLERCLDEGIKFEEVPKVFIEEGGKLRAVPDSEVRSVLAI